MKGFIQFDKVRADGFVGGGCGAASMLLACGVASVQAVAQSNLGRCFVRIEQPAILPSKMPLFAEKEAMIETPTERKK